MVDGQADWWEVKFLPSEVFLRPGRADRWKVCKKNRKGAKLSRCGYLPSQKGPACLVPFPLLVSERGVAFIQVGSETGAGS